MSGGIPSLTITMTFPRDPRLYAADHRAHMVIVNRAGATHQHKRHVPRHFESFAGAKYGYFRRTPKYDSRKLKQVGHKRPLEFTGASKRSVIAKGDIYANSKRGTLTVRLQIQGGTGRVLDAAAALRLFAAGKRKSAVITRKQVNSQAEVLKRVTEMGAISTDEINAIARLLELEYVTLANQPGQKYRVVIKTE